MKTTGAYLTEVETRQAERESIIKFCRAERVAKFSHNGLEFEFSPMAFMPDAVEETIEDEARRLEREEAARLDVLLHSAG